MNPKADFYFEKAGPWTQEIGMLRQVVLDCGLSEEVKWGCPCYIYQKQNVVLIHVFKEYCAVLFFKGALIADAEGILIQQSENVQAARQMRFTGLQEVITRAPILKAYIFEALEIEKAGLKVPMKTTREYSVPEEFQRKLDELPDLQAAFGALTPGRQRAYLLHFSQPKQSKTREARIEKNLSKIMDGKGLND
ncbi:uncharacterized protein YdeI (YjbR/CyaY-like superfamily) [Dyadobacter jejuensis]|uniref:Uncharacterized protein YdeI (YjbR/CyaY-like superfamily) n=1 Tax=Dyadobacter jejuensis TaxID=1082580 RepID=A0A316AS13_9BACT|nr:YdeI/OmpD-associated family protein [Dyadobacter jejuensis]PWJ60475.1 uncharacterized protein YdeI (YjbR/CyaY-like superfamily) [Dyadobacter jejuensis]